MFYSGTGYLGDVIANEQIPLADLLQVMDAYRRIQVSRQKKKTPTKKEKDAAIRAIKERHLIVEQLEAID